MRAFHLHRLRCEAKRVQNAVARWGVLPVSPMHEDDGDVGALLDVNLSPRIDVLNRQHLTASLAEGK